MATIELNYYAAARAAAGRSQEVIEASTVAEALQAAGRREPELARIIGISSYLLDGVALDPSTANAELSGPIRIDVLPPFAGG